MFPTPMPMPTRPPNTYWQMLLQFQLMMFPSLPMISRTLTHDRCEGYGLGHTRVFHTGTPICGRRPTHQSRSGGTGFLIMTSIT